MEFLSRQAVWLPRWAVFVSPGGVYLAGGDIGDIIPEGHGRVAGRSGRFAQMHRDVFGDDHLVQHPGRAVFHRLCTAAAAARKNMLFNPEESIDFNGNTGPFIQYTYARIRSIMRKAAADGIEIPAELGADAPINEKEIDLIQKMNDFAAAVADAGNNYNPGGIANYCYELTKEFNQFYHDYSILNAESEAEKITRLVLAANVAKILKNGMSLLGIEVPERM